MHLLTDWSTLLVNATSAFITLSVFQFVVYVEVWSNRNNVFLKLLEKGLFWWWPSLHFIFLWPLSLRLLTWIILRKPYPWDRLKQRVLLFCIKWTVPGSKGGPSRSDPGPPRLVVWRQYVSLEWFGGCEEDNQVMHGLQQLATGGILHIWANNKPKRRKRNSTWSCLTKHRPVLAIIIFYDNGKHLTQLKAITLHDER